MCFFVWKVSLILLYEIAKSYHLESCRAGFNYTSWQLIIHADVLVIRITARHMTTLPTCWPFHHDYVHVWFCTTPCNTAVVEPIVKLICLLDTYVSKDNGINAASNSKANKVTKGITLFEGIIIQHKCNGYEVNSKQQICASTVQNNFMCKTCSKYLDVFCQYKHTLKISWWGIP